MFSHTSPPINGASVIGDEIKKIIENNSKKSIYLNLSSFNEKNILLKIIDFLSKYFKLIALLNKKKIKILYFTPTISNSGFYRDFFTLLSIKIMSYNEINKFRIIIHIHQRPTSKNKFYRLLLKNIFFKNNELIFNSNELLNDYNPKDFYFSRIHILNNYVKPIYQNSITDLLEQKYLNLNKRKINLVFFGHMIISKGYLRALKIIQILDNNKLNYTANFYGSFFNISDKNLFEEFVRNNKLENKVIYKGFCDNSQKKHVFSNADVLIFPSFSESYPLSILEFMSAGVPIIATNTGAISEIFDGTDCATVCQLCSEELFILNFANKIIEIINIWDISKSNKLLDRFDELNDYNKFCNTTLKIFDLDFDKSN